MPICEKHSKSIGVGSYVVAFWKVPTDKVQGSQPQIMIADEPFKHDLADIRKWAKANGYPVGDRGRIAAEIKEAYSNQTKELLRREEEQPNS